MDLKCKQCRRAGVKLFLKGERCFSPKCAMVRRATAPGIHGSKRKRRSLSEYGLQLQEKQKLRRTYGLRERQFNIYVRKALDKKGVSAGILMKLLEMRLDNVVFRLGFASSRSQARQLVVHRFFKVNNRSVDRPSFQLKKDDRITIKDTKNKKNIVESIRKSIKKHNTPDWMELDKEILAGVIKEIPALEKINPGMDLRRIIEFYSR
jgi:small subunit ribosomal protein S4